ncbi:radical SAM protein [Streptomyces sp. NPDC087851]|uniref:radical SAM protein n=1 Tax=Streptomyces sp. NPDC087851 TaxID=3365810 RepID=UPI00381E0D48
MTEAEGSVPFRTFILKVANRCNIDCDYCFVFNSKDQAARRLPARMDLAVARAAARRIGEHASAHRLRTIHVVLHGGEPLLVGVGHMAGLLEAVRDAAPAGTWVLFELQTNGTLLSGAWLDLFERYEVAVGVSLDGPPRANEPAPADPRRAVERRCRRARHRSFCGRGRTCSRGCSPSWTWPTTLWRSTTTWRPSNRP